MDVLYALYGVPYAISPLEYNIMTEQLQEDPERLKQYERARKAYEGLLEQPLKVEPGEPNDNVRINIVKPIVNISVHYLFGSPPEIEIPKEHDGPEADTESPEEQWIDDCLESNDWATYLLDASINGSVTGTAYYAIDTDDPVDSVTTPGKTFPRFYAVDPSAMTIVPDPLNILRTRQYEWRYRTVFQGKPCLERKIYTLADDGQTWEIRMERSYLAGGSFAGLYGLQIQGANWQLIGAPVTWPYKWPPIGHTKNLPAPNQVYGAPDVTDVLIEGQVAINFNLSNRMRIDKHHGHPKVYVLGYQGDITQLDTTIGNILDIPGDNVKIGQLVPGIDSISPSQLKKEIVDGMLEESGTPSMTLGRSEPGDGGRVSGVALRMRMEPMLQKTEVKRKLYGPWMVELIRRLFELGGFGSDIRVTLTWSDLVPVDDLAQAQSLQLDKELGIVSQETLASKRGYDWQLELQRLTQEAADAESNKSLSELEAVQVADTKVNKLSIPEEQVWKELGYTPTQVSKWAKEADAEQQAQQDALTAMQTGAGQNTSETMPMGGMNGGGQPTKQANNQAAGQAAKGQASNAGGKGNAVG